MKVLLTLVLVLAASFTTYVWRGLPEVSRLERARRALAARQARLLDLQRGLDPVGYAEFAALSAHRDELGATIERRHEALTDASLSGRRPDLRETLARRIQAPELLLSRLGQQAAASPQAEQALALLLSTLSEWPELRLEELEPVAAGSPTPLDGAGRLTELRYELAVSGGLPDLISCLESMVPERGAGLPALTVLSASVRRLAPERWGPGLGRLSAPPARLSASLSIVLASPPDGPP